MAPRVRVVEQEGLRGQPRFAVVDTAAREFQVAHFAERADAEAHAARLEQGPFDWDEQERWQD